VTDIYTILFYMDIKQASVEMTRHCCKGSTKGIFVFSKPHQK